MTKKIPIGIWNFKKIIEEGYYYVDKSLLIKDIIDSGEVVLMTRPRRFGKTLNLSMLQYFYEISEQPTKHLFEDLAIWRHDEYKAFQGYYPVIFVTFKDIFQTSYEAMLKKYAFIIALEYKRHAYLLSSDILDSDDKERFNRIKSETGTELDLASSLQFLSLVLFKHHHKKVIILIDEYDVPVQAAYVNNFYTPLINFAKELLTGVLKDNPALEKGVITGIFTLAKSGIFTGLNNLDIFNLTDEKMADKYGFTSDEASALLRYYAIEDPDSVKRWYNGYIFGETHGMYNPWSILKCAEKKGQLQIFWANTSDNILLKRLIARSHPSIKSELEALLTGHEVEKIIEESIVFPDLDQRRDLIWTILLLTGYITYSHYKIKSGKKVCSLMIPNEEITFLYEDLIKQIFTELVTVGDSIEFLQALTEGKTDIFQDHLQNFVLNSISMHDLSSKEPEKSYHLFILGLLIMLKPHYNVTSNKESGLGRYDIMITPKEKHRNAIIIECKKVYGDDLDALEKGAQKALDQIIEKKYAQMLYAENIHRIIAYGIAFQGKNILIKSLIMNNSHHEKKLPVH